MEIIRVISSKTINGSFLDWLQTKFFRKLLIRSRFINLYRWKVNVFYLKKKKKKKNVQQSYKSEHLVAVYVAKHR